MRRALCAGLLCLLAGTAAAKDYRANAEDYRDYLNRLLLEPGNDLQGLPLHDLSRQAGQPIVIEAANPATMPCFIARPRANTVAWSMRDIWHCAIWNSTAATGRWMRSRKNVTAATPILSRVGSGLMFSSGVRATSV